MNEDNFKNIIKNFLIKCIEAKKFEPGKAIPKGQFTKDAIFPNRLDVYKKLRINFSFGKGCLADVFHLTFLGHNQQISRGIYPCILFAPRAITNNLEIVYGISEKAPPLVNWNGSYIHELINSRLMDGKYSSSYVKNSFTINNNDDINLNIDEIIKSIDSIIDDFKNQFIMDYNELPINNNDWYPLDYSPNFSKQDWLNLLNDKTIFYDDDLAIMKRFKDFGGAATCSQLADKYGGTAGFYNIKSSKLAHRIADATSCPTFNDDKNSKWWPILYLGKKADKDIQGDFIWKLREELSDALDEIDLTNIHLYVNDNDTSYTKYNFLSDVYTSSEDYDELCLLLKNKKNLILQGAPGVGKTFTAKRLAYSIMGEKDNNRIEMVQFHQNYTYEDFVMGYKPNGSDFELRNGIFYQFCTKAANNPDKEYFFIIDEINRGNMSKIFGELLMLIEKDYRGAEHKITLAYNQKPFYVPDNLYIIGMMNTADRSLAMIDYALRRRFSFYEIEPRFASKGFKNYQKSLSNDIFDNLMMKIEELNKDIKQDGSLGSGFCIGHSYFCNQTKCSKNWMKSIIRYEIIPMLQEYWFDDNQKVQTWINKLESVLDD
ncbi:MAG: AAA family ATPase [Alphaproteobacteria bacterium]|nr:AAA family ATPase [Alphaproteobacteria bacterium]